VRLNLQVRGLGDSFTGKRIVHVSDLHCSRTVSSKYLEHCIERVNQLQPDVVVLTGDYVTYDINGRFSEKVIPLVGKLKSTFGVYACMGNHDYGVDVIFGQLPRRGRLDELTEGMESYGVTVLRNRAGALELDGHKLWFVGLGDIWANDCEPELAFAGVGDGAVIVLFHNPESIKHLKGFRFGAALCGHTHGSRLRYSHPTTGALISRHDYSAGLYDLGDKKLYVNRGLGRHGRGFFNTRPEITVYDLC